MQNTQQAGGFASAWPDVLAAQPLQSTATKTARNGQKRQPIATRTEPARSANWRSDFATPALQSMYIGVLAGATSGVMINIASGSIDLPVTTPQAALLVGCVSTLILSFSFITDHNAALWRVEDFFGVDINQDGAVGQPQPVPPPPAFINRAPGRRDFYRVEIPFTDLEEARRVAAAVLIKGSAFTRRALVKCGAFPNHPTHYSDVYQAMRDAEFIINGELTDEGRQYLAVLLPTSLQGESTIK